MKYIISFLKESWNEQELFGIFLSCVNSYHSLGGGGAKDQLEINFIDEEDKINDKKLNIFNNINYININKISSKEKRDFYKESLLMNNQEIQNEHFMGIFYSVWKMRLSKEDFVLIEDDIFSLKKQDNIFNFNERKIQLIHGFEKNGVLTTNSLIMFVPNEFLNLLINFWKNLLIDNKFDSSLIWSKFPNFIEKWKDNIKITRKMTYWNEYGDKNSGIKLIHRNNCLFTKEFTAVYDGDINFRRRNINLFNRASEKHFHPKTKSELDIIINMSKRYFKDLKKLENKFGLNIYSKDKYLENIELYIEKWNTEIN